MLYLSFNLLFIAELADQFVSYVFEIGKAHLSADLDLTCNIRVAAAYSSEVLGRAFIDLHVFGFFNYQLVLFALTGHSLECELRVSLQHSLDFPEEAAFRQFNNVNLVLAV